MTDPRDDDAIWRCLIHDEVADRYMTKSNTWADYAKAGTWASAERVVILRA